MIDSAAGHDAVVEVDQASLWLRSGNDADVIAIDSITAWRFAGPARRSGPPRVGVVHQPPGGVDGSRLRRHVQALLDRSAYRRCDALIVAGPTVAAELVHRHGVPSGRVHVVEPGCD